MCEQSEQGRGNAAYYQLSPSRCVVRAPQEGNPGEEWTRARTRTPETVHRSGGIALREGRSAEALPLFRDLLRRAPDSLRARFQYARALSAAGQTVAADAALRDYHRRAEAARLEMELRGRLTLQPNDPTLRARLSRLLRAEESAKTRKNENAKSDPK